MTCPPTTLAIKLVSSLPASVNVLSYHPFQLALPCGQVDTTVTFVTSLSTKWLRVWVNIFRIERFWYKLFEYPHVKKTVQGISTMRLYSIDTAMPIIPRSPAIAADIAVESRTATPAEDVPLVLEDVGEVAVLLEDEEPVALLQLTLDGTLVLLDTVISAHYKSYSRQL